MQHAWLLQTNQLARNKITFMILLLPPMIMRHSANDPFNKKSNNQTIKINQRFMTANFISNKNPPLAAYRYPLKYGTHTLAIGVTRLWSVGPIL